MKKINNKFLYLAIPAIFLTACGGKQEKENNIEYGKIEEYVPEKELRKNEVKNQEIESIKKYWDSDSVLPEYEYKEKEARDKDYNITELVKAYETENESFKIRHCMYYKENKEIILRAHINNLTDNRKKRIVLVAYDARGKILASGEVYQNSKANQKVYFTIKAPIYKSDGFAEDIAKIELYAEPVEVDRFAF